MPLVINTNVSALNSQRQLARSGMDMDQAMERLSSGRRVNNAADDAAGLAIANRMTSQILGLNQAIRNANDGVSLIQTAEGALDETTNILQRMRELSIQAANGIYSDTDRATLDAEVQQLKSELDRIAESTTFNGQVLLDGSLGNVTLQVGSESEDTISLSVGAMDTDTLGGGNGADVVGIPMNTTASQLGDDILNDAGSGQSLSINGQNVGDLTGVENMNDLLDAVNAAVSGIEVTSFVELTASADGTGVLRDIDLILTISDLNSEAQIYRITDTGNMNELAQKITDVTGGVVTATIGDNGRLQMTSDTAASITASNTAGTEATTAAGLGTNAYRAQLALEITDDSISDIDIDIVGSTNLTSGTEFDNITQGLGLQDRDDGDVTSALLTAGGTAAIVEGDLVINDVALSGMADGATASQQAIALAALINTKSGDHGVVATITDTGDTRLKLDSVDGTEISVEFAGTSATYLTTGFIETNNSLTSGDNVNGVAVNTVTGAQAAISVIDSALEEINSVRSDLGAANNRLDFTVSNLSNVVENTSAARSRIMDADFATETSQLSRAQVLQQASQAILAQANARPQQVLSLLN